MQKNTPRAKSFIATRQHHLIEAAEDYTELIADLSESEGEARTCSIASHLGVSHVTAINTLKRLQKEGYVKTTPHKPVVLTAKGRKLAKQAKRRHKIVLEFLLKLGIPEHVAVIDAEGMEHHLSGQTLKAFQKHLKNASFG